MEAMEAMLLYSHDLTQSNEGLIARFCSISTVGMFDICDAIYVQFLWLFVQNCLVSGLLHKRTMMRTRLLVNVLQGFLAAAASVNL